MNEIAPPGQLDRWAAYQMSSIQSTFAGAILLLVTSQLIAGQIRDDRVFKLIPPASRTELISRLNLLFEYNRTKQFEKLFDLLATDWLSKSGLPSDRDGYAVFERQRDAEAVYCLLSFKPTSISKPNPDNPDVYRIRGRAKLQFRQTNRITNEDYFIEVRWQNSQWYFSEPFTVVFSVGAPNKSLDRSGGSVFRIKLGVAKVE